MPETFFEDPRTFKPKLGLHGQIQTWGIFPYNEDNIWDFDGIQMMYRTMAHQFSYDNHSGTPWPENQFMNVLKDCKCEQLSKIDLADLDKKDIVIKIHLKFLQDANGDPCIWHWVRLSAGYEISTATRSQISEMALYLALRYMLAHLFSKVGNTFAHLYDYGDKWHHEIEIEKIFPVKELYGHVQILNGKGMCPGENMRGLYQYQNFLKAYNTDSYTEQY
ncbi:hypothetical protein BDR06DRAFT_966907 [Suillus hirtellus]|nr:hypothetical protein BDR06DRAFT_966907 [Suillus hirtellus]